MKEQWEQGFVTGHDFSRAAGVDFLFRADF
jgi:hypothetical protein